MRRSFVVVLAVAFGAIALVAGVFAAFEVGPFSKSVDEAGPPPGEIVFTRGTDSAPRPSLHATRPDGSHVRLLVRNAADAAVSRDGLRIAFERDLAIWVMRRDGSGQRQLTKRLRPQKRDDFLCPWYDSDPAWSSDGQKVYFSRYVCADDTASLFSISSNSSVLQRITKAEPTPNGHCQIDPSPSPNGRIIVYTNHEDCVHYPGGLAAVTVSGAEFHVPGLLRLSATFEGTSIVSEFEMYEGSSYLGTFDPAWSPSGSLLAYAVQPYDSPPGYEGLYVSPPDGSRLRRVTSVSASSPAWSPEGDWITFEGSSDSDSANVWLVRLDGSGLRQVTRGKQGSQDPAWLPATP